MIWKYFEFNNKIIAKATADYRIWLTDVRWKDLIVSEEFLNIQWYHWIKTSPTLARSRPITIEWLILADNREWLNKGAFYLQNLFALQSSTGTTEFKYFMAVDEEDKRWRIQCKIKEPVSIELNDDDYIDGANRKFRVVLEAENPVFYWVDNNIFNWFEWVFWWTTLGTELWISLNSYFNDVKIITESNIETPLIITITALNDIVSPLLINNITNWTFFGLDINAVAGDVIIINSKEKTATKNWVSILANRISGSIWSKAKGETNFSIFDNNWGLLESWFSINVVYNDAFL